MKPDAIDRPVCLLPLQRQAEDFLAQPLEVIRDRTVVIVLNHRDSLGRGFGDSYASADLCLERLVTEDPLQFEFEIPVEPAVFVVVVQSDPD